ncbi:GDSL-type esterase/lipase family protein [Paenibacillus sp. D51F]
MDSSRLWRILGTGSLAATLLLGGGFVYAVQDMLGSGSGLSAPAKKPVLAETGGSFADASTIYVTALGDSLTKGIGDNTGEGYVKQVLKGLGEATGKPVQQINNLAVAGLTASELDEMLEKDQGMAYPIRQANLILLTIGGNDLFRTALAQAEDGNAADISVESVASRIPDAIASFKSVIGRIRAINPDATIAYIGLYNPFYDIPELKEGIVPVQKWNDEAFAVLGKDPHAVLVPVLDLFQLHGSGYLSSDHFHPNHEGYVRISDRIIQSLS